MKTKTTLVIIDDFGHHGIEDFVFTREIDVNLIDTNKVKLYSDIECTKEIEYDMIVEWFMKMDTDAVQIEIIDWIEESWFNRFMRTYFGRNYIAV